MTEREDAITRLRRLYAEASPGQMEYDSERGWVLDESGDVALRSYTWGIGPLAADALTALPALLDVARKALEWLEWIEGEGGDEPCGEPCHGCNLRAALTRLEEVVK